MKPKPPKCLKDDYHDLIFDNQRFQIRDGKAVPDKMVLAKIPACLTDKKIVQIEVVPKRACFAVCFVCEDDAEHEQIVLNDKVMGTYPGLNNLAAYATRFQRGALADKQQAAEKHHPVLQQRDRQSKGSPKNWHPRIRSAKIEWGGGNRAERFFAQRFDGADYLLGNP